MFGPRSWRTKRAHNLGPNIFPSGPTQTQSIRHVYTTEEKWQGSDKKWNGSTHFCSSYGTLSVQRKLNNLARFHVRRHLAESLVLSHLNYACTVFYPLPVYQEKRLQRLQNACAGFVTRKFAGLEDIIKVNWLPVKENVEFNVFKLAHKSLYDKNSIK